MPIIITIPSGNWGVGPSLLYLGGVFGTLVWLAWQEHKAAERDPNREALDAESGAAEKQKADRFTQLLIEAAQERRAQRKAWRAWARRYFKWGA